MALVLKDRVKETSLTTGTGDITLAGATGAFQPFSVIGDGNTTYYAVAGQTTSEWEVGIGTYTLSTNTLSRDTVLASSSSGTLVNFSAGTKDIFVTYPSEKAVYLDSIDESNSAVTIGTTAVKLGETTDTLAGLESVEVTQDPVSALQLATKQYVDTLVASGIHFHQPVRVESPINLNATYDNGTAGVGATLTNAGTQEALVIDGITVSVADRVLVYEQTTQTQNGVYVVTDVGSVSTNWILTRASDADTYVIDSPNGLSEGSTFFVREGTTGAGETYTCNTSGVITFGTTNITFAQISSAQIYSAGTGLTLAGTQFSISNTTVTPAAYGAASKTLTATVNAQGQLTALADTDISIPASYVTSGTLAVERGGTNIGSYAIGDLIYASGTTTLSKLSSPAVGNVLISNGLTTAPSWSTSLSLTGSLAATALTIETNTTTDAVRITQTGTGNAFVVEDSSSPDATPFVIDSDGRVINGATTSIASSEYSNGVALQIHGAGENSVTQIGQWSNSAGGNSKIELSKSRGTPAGTQVIVQNGDNVGQVRFTASDGIGLIPTASILSAVDGTPGTNDMPGRLVFSTTPDGSASTVERMRITSAGNVGIGTSTPARLLELSSSATVGARISGTVPFLEFFETDITDENKRLRVNSGVLVFENINDDANVTTELFRIASSGISTFTGNAVVNANTTTDAVRITQTGTGNAFVVEDSSSPDATPFVIDADGRLIVGSSTSQTINNLTASFQVNGTAFGNSTLSVNRFNNALAANSPTLTFGRSRGATIGTNTSVASGDVLGQVLFRGADGTSYVDAAFISSAVDGTPGTNDMPGRLMFFTTPSGSATPVERMRIDSAGRLDMRTSMGTGGGTGTASTISGTTLTIGGTVSGFIAVGQRIWGAGVEPNTFITALGTGTGGAGTYIINNSQTVSSTTISCIESGWNTFRFTDTDTTASVNQPMGQIEWFGSDTSTPGAGVKAYIAGVSESATPDTALIFGTSDNVASTQAVERMRITSAGNVGIGTGGGANFLLSVGNPNYGLDWNGSKLSLRQVGSSANSVGIESIGDVVISSDTNATTSGDIILSTATVERMRIDRAGQIATGGSTLNGINFWNRRNLTGASLSYGYALTTTIQSDVTSATGYFTNISTQAATFTTANLVHYDAASSAFGAGSTVTNQFGFRANSSLTGATNNYGFYGNIASGTGRWNFYANGTAPNYFAGNVGIGAASPAANLHIQSASDTVLLIKATGGTDNEAILRLDSAPGGESQIDFQVDAVNVVRIECFETGNRFGIFAIKPEMAMTFGTNNTERMRIDSAGDVDIGTSTLGTGTDTRTLTVASNGYAVVNINGDYSNTSGEPGGSALTLAVDGTGINGLVSYINAAGNRGDSSATYTGTTSNSMLVGTTAGVLHLGASGAVRATISTTGVFQFDSGYGSVAPAYGCRAWVNFNGTGTVAIRASGNVSSITDNGIGNYTVNFTTAMPDGKYMVALGQPSGATGSLDGRQQALSVVQVAGDYSTSSVQVSCYNTVSGSTADPLQVNIAIFR
jgi:hypothetical protein